VIAVTMRTGALARRLAAIFAALARRRLHRLRPTPARAHILPKRGTDYLKFDRHGRA
jgi:hypothetical protein